MGQTTSNFTPEYSTDSDNYKEKYLECLDRNKSYLKSNIFLRQQIANNFNAPNNIVGGNINLLDQNEYKYLKYKIKYENELKKQQRYYN